MPNPVLGMMGASIGGSVLQGGLASRAAGQAATAQTQAAQLGIAEQRRQYDAAAELLRPYVQAGTTAIGQQGALIGTQGAPAQQAAIDALMAGPEYQSLLSAGENAILQNAAATGGLRGGNTQDALMRYRPEVLSGLIGQQFQRLGGLAGMGQASAAGQAANALQLGQNVSGLMQQQGAAQAGANLARGQAWGNSVGNIAGGLGYGFGAFATPPGSPGGLPSGASLFGRWGF